MLMSKENLSQHRANVAAYVGPMLAQRMHVIWETSQKFSLETINMLYLYEKNGWGTCSHELRLSLSLEALYSKHHC